MQRILFGLIVVEQRSNIAASGMRTVAKHRQIRGQIINFAPPDGALRRGCPGRTANG
jgi:hypothetical protein